MGGGLAIDRFGHHKTPAIMCVGQPASGVLDAGLTAHRDKHSIVEFFRPGDVVAPDHNMAEHSVLSSSESHVARPPRPTTSTRFDEAMIGKEKKRSRHRHPRPPVTASKYTMPRGRSILQGEPPLGKAPRRRDGCGLVQRLNFSGWASVGLELRRHQLNEAIGGEFAIGARDIEMG